MHGHPDTTIADDVTSAGGTPTHRRTLLGALAAGFVLTASGVFLPGTIGEAEALGGAGAAKRAGSITKNGGGRHKNRNHGRRRHRQNRAPGTFILGVEVEVVYTRPSESVNAAFWVRTQAGHAFGEQESKAVTSTGAIFHTGDIYGVLWIANRYYASFSNDIGYPATTLGYGGTFDSRGWYGGTKVVNNRGLSENEVAPALHIDGYTYEVKRLTDSADYKRFKLTIS